METREVAPAAPEAPRPISIGRRQLLRGAAGAAPVVLSLASRPVIAGECAQATAFGSLNASRPGVTALCSGRSPGYWKNHTNWPTGYVASNSGPSTGAGNSLMAGRQTAARPTQFNDVFGKSSGYPGLSLLDVLNQGQGGDKALARHIVAALLNAAQGLTPPTILSVSKVKTIWTSYAMTGYYSPTPGMRWNAGEIIAWLDTTMS